MVGAWFASRVAGRGSRETSAHHIGYSPQKVVIVSFRSFIFTAWLIISSNPGLGLDEISEF